MSKSIPVDEKLWSEIQALAKGERKKSVVRGNNSVSPVNEGKGFTTFPSAYANGWALSQYKRLGGKWKKESSDFKKPRKWDKEYCESKSCDDMGFSEKASCRPYKNCYSKEASSLLPPPPPLRELIQELPYVSFQYENRYNHESLQPYLDKCFWLVFDHVLKVNGHESRGRELKEICEKIVPLILSLKTKYNCMRPNQLAEMKGIPFQFDFLETAQSPSYPSGHATQAYYLAHKLSEEYPHLRQDLFSVAKRVSESRVDRGVHFISDIEAGEILAENLYNQEKDQPKSRVARRYLESVKRDDPKKKNTGKGGLGTWFAGHGGGNPDDRATWGDWIAITPVKHTITKDDGKKKTYEPGDIVGPCAVSSEKDWSDVTSGGKKPLKCMPREKAWNMPKKDRAELAKKKRREEAKHRGQKPVNTPTFSEEAKEITKKKKKKKTSGLIRPPKNLLDKVAEIGKGLLAQYWIKREKEDSSKGGLDLDSVEGLELILDELDYLPLGVKRGEHDEEEVIFQVNNVQRAFSEIDEQMESANLKYSEFHKIKAKIDQLDAQSIFNDPRGNKAHIGSISDKASDLLRELKKWSTGSKQYIPTLMRDDYLEAVERLSKYKVKDSGRYYVEDDELGLVAVHLQESSHGAAQYYWDGIHHIIFNVLKNMTELPLKYLTDRETIAGHELVHAMQQHYANKANIEEAGLPSQKRDKQFRFDMKEKQKELRVQYAREGMDFELISIHALDDIEFYSRLLDEVTEFKRRNKVLNDEIHKWVKKRPFFVSLKRFKRRNWKKAVGIFVDAVQLNAKSKKYKEKASASRIAFLYLQAGSQPAQDLGGVRTWVDKSRQDQIKTDTNPEVSRPDYADGKPQRDRVLPLPSGHPEGRDEQRYGPGLINSPPDSSGQGGANRPKKDPSALSDHPNDKALHERPRSSGIPGDQYGNPYIDQSQSTGLMRRVMGSARQLFHATRSPIVPSIIRGGLITAPSLRHNQQLNQIGISQNGISTSEDFSALSKGDFGNAIFILDRSEIERNFETEKIDHWGDNREKEVRVYTDKIPPKYLKGLVFLDKPKRFETDWMLENYALPLYYVNKRGGFERLTELDGKKRRVASDNDLYWDIEGDDLVKVALFRYNHRPPRGEKRQREQKGQAKRQSLKNKRKNRVKYRRNLLKQKRLYPRKKHNPTYRRYKKNYAKNPQRYKRKPGGGVSTNAQKNQRGEKRRNKK